MRQNAAIIGAGTAGLIAARRLAELGVHTKVFDQKRVPGFPVRASGILSINGLQTLGVDYKKVVTNVLHGAYLNVGSHRIRIKSQKPMAYVLERQRLNELCQDQAAGMGAEIVLDKKVGKAELDELSKSNIIVGADGAISQVASHFGFPSIQKHILTFRAEYEHSLEEKEMVELFFDKSITPGFFGWIAPEAHDRTEIGIGIDSRFGNSKDAFEKFKKIPQLSTITSSRLVGEGASMIPVGVRKKFADNEKGVVLIGDAAGHVKPTTGGGIIFGGNGALCAADAIERHIKDKTSLLEYERKWRKEFDTEVLLHDLFYSMYSKMSMQGLERAAVAMKILHLDSFLGKYGDMDRPSLVIKRFFLRGLVK